MKELNQLLLSVPEHDELLQPISEDFFPLILELGNAEPNDELFMSYTDFIRKYSKTLTGQAVELLAKRLKALIVNPDAALFLFLLNEVETYGKAGVSSLWVKALSDLAKMKDFPEVLRLTDVLEHFRNMCPTPEAYSLAWKAQKRRGDINSVDDFRTHPTYMHNATTIMNKMV